MAHAAWSHRTLARLALLGTCQGQSIVSVYHFEATPVRDPTLTSDTIARQWADDVAEDWETNCKAAWLAIHTADYSLINIQSQVLQRPSQVDRALTPTDRTPGTPVVGAITGPVDDMTTAVVIKWRSDVAGKAHRGRTYVGPLSDAMADAGRLASGYVAGFTAYITVMQNRYTGASALFSDANLTIYSRPYNSGEYRYVKGSGPSMQIVIPPDYNGDSTNVIGGNVDLVLRTQRRRQLGVGS